MQRGHETRHEVIFIYKIDYHHLAVTSISAFSKRFCLNLFYATGSRLTSQNLIVKEMTSAGQNWHCLSLDTTQVRRHSALTFFIKMIPVLCNYICWFNVHYIFYYIRSYYCFVLLAYFWRWKKCVYKMDHQKKSYASKYSWNQIFTLLKNTHKLFFFSVDH